MGDVTTRRALVASAGLVTVGVGSVTLAALGNWSASTTEAIALLALIVGPVVALAALRRLRWRWPSLAVFAYAAVFGLMLVGVGVPPDGDMGPEPWKDAAIAAGGPQVAVGVAWLVAGCLGFLALAGITRRRTDDRGQGATAVRDAG